MRQWRLFGMSLPPRGLITLLGGCILLIAFAADFSYGR